MGGWRAAITTGLFLAGLISPAYAQTPVPDRLEGARSVVKYATPGSTRTIIHLRQIHRSSTIPDSLEDKIGFLAVHADLASIADQLRPWTTDVYFEDWTASDITMLDSVISKYIAMEQERIRITNRLCEIDTSHPCTSTDVRALEPLREIYGSLFADLYVTGRIRLHGAQDPGLIRRIEELEARATAADSAQAKDIIFRQREDYAIETIMRSEHHTAMLVFGVFHDFRRSVTHWNRAHPDRTVSLIVVTPQSYDPSLCLRKNDAGELHVTTCVDTRR